ncbi:hypothetical protein [Spongiimicrobium salis]|uniref:hypothetical protein n=1 Tax=Spongiimicrobium salis TaxID=1667022 RepID=UPI00374D0438
MVLYNFFTEIVSKEDTEKYENLLAAEEDITRIFKGQGHCRVVKSENNGYSLMGQIYGSDTTKGDTDLLAILQGIKYTWFDAHQPQINNIQS